MNNLYLNMNKHHYTLFALLWLCCLPTMAQLNGTGYYRMRNSVNTSDYISISDSLFNFTTVISSACGGLSQAFSDAGIARAMACAGAFLKTDIHMVEDGDCVDPSTIVYLKKRNTNTSNLEYNLIGQTVSLLDLTTGTYPGKVHLEFKERYITIDNVEGSGANALYSASIELKSDTYVIFYGYPNLGVRYFIDDENNQFGIYENNGNLINRAKWYIEPVSSFHVKPTVEYKGKYYATMYVPFEYELGGHVLNAYVVTAINEDGSLEKLSIASTGGTVPAGTPVVLECDSNNPQDNLLTPKGTPKTDDTSNYSGDNLLKGAYICNQDGNVSFPTPSGTSSFNANRYVKYVSTNMFVLGIGSKSGRLGFFKYTGTAMKANKAWLELPAGSANEAYTLDFDEPTQKGGNNE